jgi:predicted DCC family thiol-disulfide oxidoreductase YuxK
MQEQGLSKAMEDKIVLFDGVCNLCDNSVKFIIKRDKRGIFKMASLQSEVGMQLQEKYGQDTSKINSVMLIENDKIYTKSTAALRIAKHLDGPWKLFIVFMIIPAPIRDIVYDFIARNRYRWFGKHDACMIPDKSIKARFL